MADDYRTVDTFEVTAKVTVTEYDMPEGQRVYDWVMDNGSESDRWFDSAEEARTDAYSRFV